MRKSLVLASAFALAMAAAKPTLAAETIAFDVNGAAAGGGMFANLFDWLPGSSLLVEDAALTPDGMGQLVGTGTIYFQANLGTIVGPVPGPSDDFANGSCAVGNCFFTAVAGFDVNITQQTLVSGGSITQFSLDLAGTTNFFKIYANNTSADDLTGICFACGTEILSGSGISGSSNFVVANLDQSLLDQSPNGNQWGGTQTLSGIGSTNVTVRVDSFDATYFLDLIAGSSLAFSNTSQIAPYTQVDPSRAFSTDGVGAPDKNSNVGAVNGLSTLETLAQSDANTSFETPLGTSVVPEPATMTLFGLGLLGSAAARRRAKNGKK